MLEQKNGLSRRAKIFVVCTLFFISSAFLPAKWFGVKEPQPTGLVIDYSQYKSIQETTKDADNNGTLTWREVMVSNDDGAALLEEIKDVKPDPQIDKLISDPNNLTAAFSKNLLLSSTYIKNNNITDEESQKNILTGITSEIKERTESKKYTRSDIKIAKTETPATIRAYGNQVGGIVSNMITKKNLEEDLPGLLLYLEEANKATLQPIQTDAKKVESILQKLLSIEVPSSAVTQHLILVNAAIQYRDVLSSLSTVVDDPIRAAAVIEKYPQTVLSAITPYTILADYFKIKKIIYSASEPGYMFTAGFTLK